MQSPSHRRSRPSRADAFAGMRFRHTWRGYQARVLAALGEHLEDRTLHVVAPPGSGKTALGLEVVRRLGYPALVLTPTVPVREQWLRRFHDAFPPAPRALVSAVSRDPMRPELLTASTYQALAQEVRNGN